GKDDVEDYINPLCNMISRKAEFVSCYQSIIDSVQEAEPCAAIYIGIPAPIQNCIWRKHQERYLQELMPFFAEILAANPDIRKIDVHAAFEKLDKEKVSMLYQEDGLHPNPAGLQLIADTVYRALQLQD
ncbi:MAG: SGNH/GDSL hydrolase family protein, partial [Lachnospiraceae bacterium]|nr:SGNH/GDSL hydrolase family protein [Lachnospiraceae bacterium]